jgi:hypothetical protein
VFPSAATTIDEWLCYGRAYEQKGKKRQALLLLVLRSEWRVDDGAEADFSFLSSSFGFYAFESLKGGA